MVKENLMVPHNEAFKKVETALKSIGFRLQKANVYTGWMHMLPPANEKAAYSEMRVWVDTKNSKRSAIQIICEKKSMFGLMNAFKSFEEEEEKILDQIKNKLKESGSLNLIPNS